jgi:hypothetical protein
MLPDLFSLNINLQQIDFYSEITVPQQKKVCVLCSKQNLYPAFCSFLLTSSSGFILAFFFSSFRRCFCTTDSPRFRGNAGINCRARRKGRSLCL